LINFFYSKNKIVCYTIGPWVLFYLGSQNTELFIEEMLNCESKN